MAYSSNNRRIKKRIQHPYFLTFKQIHPPTLSKTWESSTARNISKSGIFFLASRDYKPGVTLTIKMKNPFLKAENELKGTVTRCTAVSKMNNCYQVAVKIIEIEEPLDAFTEAIDHYLKQNEQTPHKSSKQEK